MRKLASTYYGLRFLVQRKPYFSRASTVFNPVPPHSFKVTEVAIMMDWEDSSGSSSDEDTDDQWTIPSSVRAVDSMTSTSRGSMRGLQTAIQDGWLVQRARDMCSFTHDRFRQAAQAEVANLPEGVSSKMSFRVSADPLNMHDNCLNASSPDHSHDAPRESRYLPYRGAC